MSAGTARPTKRASSHHGGAASGKLGTACGCEPSQILNRFPIQNRRDQARQQMSAGTARPTKRASSHHGGAASGKLGTACGCEPSQILNRFPIQNRRDQTRQQSSADTVRPTKRASRHHGGAASGEVGNRLPLRIKSDFESLPDSKSSRPSAAANVCGHRPPDKARKPLPRRRSEREVGHNLPLRTKSDFESLPDSKSSRPSAAAIVCGHRPPDKARKPPPRRRSEREVGHSLRLRTKSDFESLPDSKSSRPSAAAIVCGHCPLTCEWGR